MTEPTAYPGPLVMPPVGVVDYWGLHDRHGGQSGCRVVMTRTAWEGMDPATRPAAHPGASGGLVSIETRWPVVFPGDLRRMVFREAVDSYWEAIARRNRVLEAGEDCDDLDRWSDLACRAVDDAERHLILAVLSWAPGLDRVDPDTLRRYHPPTGVRFGGRLYLAVPSDGSNPGDAVPSGTMIGLVVVDEGSISLVG